MRVFEMIRRTSIEAYNYCQQEGILATVDKLVYNALFDHGPLTVGELWDKFMPQYQRHTINPVPARLKARGLIFEALERPCDYSGHTCIAWDVTGNLPQDPPERETKEEVIARQAKRIQELEAELAATKKLVPRQPALFGH